MAGIAVAYGTVNQEYYDKKHLPLASERIGKWVRDLRVLRGAGPFCQLTIVDFKDGVSVSEVLGSAEMGEVLGDLPNFTDPQTVQVLQFE